MKKLIISFFCLISVLLARNYCPVTSRHSVSSTGYLPYPYLYWPYNPKQEKDESIYNCTVRPAAKQKIIGNCYPDRSCVVTAEEVMAALQVQTWEPIMDGICNLEKTRQNDHSMHPQNINLIIIGGSMTAGSGTSGECFCTHTEDSRCPDFDRSDIMYSFCSWPTQFLNWIVQEFPNVQFDILNLATGGLDSQTVPTYIAPYFQHLNFSNNDIIILDESVNDAGKPYDQLQRSVELMIRRIYSFTRGTFPTIIMIEQFPHRSQADALAHKTTFDNRILPGDYSVIYRSLSEKYKFVYYSVREVYWTYYNPKIEQVKRYPFSPFIDHHYEAHPPWYFHTFMADIISNCFLYSLSRCNRPSHTNSSSLELPPSDSELIKNDDYCDPNSEYLLDAHAKNHFQPKNLTDYEEGLDVGSYGWREYVDYHNIPGWIINDKSNPLLRNLTFPLNQDREYKGSYEDILVIILYLRSYVGMGIAEIHVCGIPSEPRIDGIFPDHKTNRVSIPQVATYRITPVQNKACHKLRREDRTITIVYRPDITTNLDHLRHHKKLKILSVESCKKFHSQN